jgi:hypothetical protein
MPRNKPRPRSSHQAVHHDTQQAEAPFASSCAEVLPASKPCTNDAQAEVLPLLHQAVHHATHRREALTPQFLITHVHQDLQPGIAEAGHWGKPSAAQGSRHRLHAIFRSKALTYHGFEQELQDPAASTPGKPGRWSPTASRWCGPGCKQPHRAFPRGLPMDTYVPLVLAEPAET